MKRTKYAAEFNLEAVKQVIDKDHTVVDIAKLLGIAEGVLYTWVSKFKKADEPVTVELGCRFGLHLRFDFFVRQGSWIL